MRAFVAGTDTGVGKTRACVLLTRALRASGMDTVALKPVCCGDRADAHLLRGAADNELDLDDVNPIHLHAPLAPLAAARAGGVTLETGPLVAWFRRVAGGRASVLVEGAGGWLVPFAPGVSMADLAVAFDLPVLLVVANRLGCINHTLLTLESVRARGLPCPGLVLNQCETRPEDASTGVNRPLLEEVSGLPVLFEISHGQESLEVACA
jgi:dethiobiotin synthetase